MANHFQTEVYSISIKHVLMVFITLLMLLTVLLAMPLFTSKPIINTSPPETVYLGVSFCGNTTAEAKLLIDKIKNYTNLFVLQSGPISRNMTATTEICDYATSQGLNIIVFLGWFNPEHLWQTYWVQNATQWYGDKFLGVYYYDEPGGIQLDYDWENYFTNLYNRLNRSEANSGRYQDLFGSIEGYLNGTIRNYDAGAQIYTVYMQQDRDIAFLRSNSIPAFVSDYALFWWDYLGGYDVVLAQLGNNASIIQEIDLTKGAAHLQDKDWGAIVTWKYTEAPYLDSGEEIYKQLFMAYQAGAKYLIVFDYPTIENNSYGVLTDDHFEALQKLWTDINKPTSNRLTTVEAVLVLPRNYGWGMRHVEDRIWLWSSDEHSQTIWNISQKLINQYGTNLDIVYDDPQFPVTDKYPNVYYWNQTLVY
jgi:hypothetical protein